MAKCDICKEKISTTFLSKPLGTYIYDKGHKKHLICLNCQKKFNTDKETILTNLN